MYKKCFIEMRRKTRKEGGWDEFLDGFKDSFKLVGDLVNNPVRAIKDTVKGNWIDNVKRGRGYGNRNKFNTIVQKMISTRKNIRRKEGVKKRGRKKRIHFYRKNRLLNQRRYSKVKKRKGFLPQIAAAVLGHWINGAIDEIF